MKRCSLDKQWQFQHGKPSTIPGFEAKQEIINLPHDFMISSDVSPDAPGGHESGFYKGGLGTYTKVLDIGSEEEAKRYILEFDGSYMHTMVSLNGHLVARHHNGYSPFHVELTPFIKYNQGNRLEIRVDNEAQPSGRWYTGSGIYRHLDLLSGGAITLKPWSLFAYTQTIVNDVATIVAEAQVENKTATNQELWVDFKLIKDEGRDSSLDLDKELEDSETKGSVKIELAPGEVQTAKIRLSLANPLIWDLDNPHLYQLVAQVRTDLEILDQDHTLFGVRTMSLDTQNGFCLNGQTVKLKGGCIHHDNGILGAVSYFESEYRKMKIHKENGYNAIRFAHNPMSRDLLEACDRLGLLVINEAFDVWTMEKNPHDYSHYFEQNWEQDLTDFVLRDRNHPSVIFWSIGNEIPERGKLSHGARWAKRLSDKVRSLDPSRFVTAALCSFFNGLDDDDKATFWDYLKKEAASQLGNGIINLDSSFGREIFHPYTEAFSATLDMVGYNYLAYHYPESIKQFPHRIMCSTESKPSEFEAYWEAVEKYPQVIGDFLWTSYDYIGEAGLGRLEHVPQEEVAKTAMMMSVVPYPWRLAYGSDFDLLGNPRPQSAFHRIVWGSSETYIASFDPQFKDLVEVKGRYAWGTCANSWTYPGYEGENIVVDVYSRADEVALFLNGEEIGRKPAGEKEHYKASFVLPYRAGTLKAVSYVDGEIISYDEIKTAGTPSKLALTLEEGDYDKDIYHVRVEIVDEIGQRVPYAEENLSVKVEGEGQLLAFGTARPVTEENYTKGEITTFEGRALAIIRKDGPSSSAMLTVDSQKLGQISLTI